MSIHCSAQRPRTCPRLILVAATVGVVGLQSVQGITGSWIGPATAESLGGDNLWSNPANWDIIPGNTLGAAGSSSDIALLAEDVLEPSVAVDLNRNVFGFQFHVTSQTLVVGRPIGHADFLTQNPIYLSGGGVTETLNSSNFSDPGDIFAPMILNGNSYTFTNASPISGIRLRNTVRPADGVNGVVTVTFNGLHRPGTSGSDAEVREPIMNGLNSVVSVVKDGPGSWEMQQTPENPNTYSGDTIINEGVLRTTGSSGTTQGLGGISPNSNYIINPTGVLRISSADLVNNVFSTAKSITVYAGGSLTSTTAATFGINLKSDSGPGLLIDLTPTIKNGVTYLGSGTLSTGENPNVSLGTGTISLPINLTGTVPLEGGITFVGSTESSTLSLGSTSGTGIDLGSVLRVFDIGQGATINPDITASWDVRIRQPLKGGSATGGLVKRGAGTLRLEHAANPFTGTLQIEEGTVNFDKDDALTGNPSLVIAGGTMHLFGTPGEGALQSFNTVTLNKGSITAGSSDVSTVKATNFLLDVASSDVALSAAIFADSTSAASVVKTGGGVATLTGSNTYSGNTTVAGGTLVLTERAQHAALEGPGQTIINAGLLVLDYEGGGPVNTVRSILTAGSPGNFQSGQIHTTNAPDPNRGIGYIDDTDTTQILIRYTYRGDANLDGVVNALDFNALATNFGLGAGTDWVKGDFNYDGVINTADFDFIATSFNAAALPSPEVPALGTLVPEPAGLLLASLGAALGISRKRRR